MHVATLFFFILISICLFSCVIYYPYATRVTTRRTTRDGDITVTTTYDVTPEGSVLKM